MWAGRLVALLAAALALLTAAVLALGELPGEQRLLTSVAAVEGDELWRAVDAGTGYLPMGVLAAVLSLLLVRLRRRREALLVLLSYAGAVVGTTLLKHLVGRERPETVPAVVDVSDLTYPSGHATATAALALAVVLVTRGSRPVLAAAVVLVVTTAAAQLLLGLHFPSDLLAGWLVAGAVTCAGWTWLRTRAPTA